VRSSQVQEDRPFKLEEEEEEEEEELPQPVQGQCTREATARLPSPPTPPSPPPLHAVPPDPPPQLSTRLGHVSSLTARRCLEIQAC
jgi:hypothetical protein